MKMSPACLDELLSGLKAKMRRYCLRDSISNCMFLSRSPYAVTNTTLFLKSDVLSQQAEFFAVRLRNYAQVIT